MQSIQQLQLQQLTQTVTQDKIYHWLAIGYTHVICYNNPVDQEYLAFCYFPSSTTGTQVKASIEALKNNNMVGVTAHSLQDLLLSY